MKVLLTHRPGGAYGFISDGWKNAFSACGHDVRRWDNQQSTWDTFDPDLYIGCSGHRQSVPSPMRGDVKRRAKIVIHVNPYSITSSTFGESQDAITWTVAQKPDAVFGYGHDSDRHLWAKWEQHAPWVPMPTAGDSTMFYPRVDAANGNTRFMGMCYIGGYWPYKARNIDRYLVPMAMAGRDICHIFGWGDWPHKLCRGTPSDEAVPGLLSAARVGPCISEPHTNQLGIDLPERIFKVALSGAVVVHDSVFGLSRYMANAVVGYSPDDYAAKCRYWSQAPDDERSDLASRQRQEILAGHTYYHRLYKLLQTLGFDKEAYEMTNRANMDAQ